MQMLLVYQKLIYTEAAQKLKWNELERCSW